MPTACCRPAARSDFGGNLRLNVGQPATFAAWWRGRGEGGAGRLLAPFEFAGHATIGPGHVIVDSMKTSIGDATLSGRFAWSDVNARASKRLLGTDLVADRLDFVQLRAMAELLAGRDLADAATLADSYAVKLAAQELVIEDITMRDVSVDAGFVDGALTVRNVVVGNLGGARFSATRGQIDSIFTAPRGHLEAHLDAPSLQDLSRVVDRVAPDSPFSHWLSVAAPALSPAAIDASIEAPPAAGGANYRIKLHASAKATQADATIDLTGSPVAWRSGTAAVTLDVSSYDAVGLARQAGLAAAAGDLQKSARIQIGAHGVPKDGLVTTVTGDFGGVGLSAAGTLVLAAGQVPSFNGTFKLQSDDLDPIVKMAGLEIPGEEPGIPATLDGKIGFVGTAGEVEWKDGTIAGRPVGAKLSVDGTRQRNARSEWQRYLGQRRSRLARLARPRLGSPADRRSCRALVAHAIRQPDLRQSEQQARYRGEPSHRRPRLRRRQSRAWRGRPPRSPRSRAARGWHRRRHGQGWRVDPQCRRQCQCRRAGFR